VLQVCKTCLLSSTFLLFFAFQARSQTYPGENPQVVVSVYNKAGVSAMVLGQAEREAQQDGQDADLQRAHGAPAKHRQIGHQHPQI